MDDQQARREYWLEQVRAWRESGLTQAGYCRQHGLKSSALGYWIARHKTLNAGLTLVPVSVHPSANTEAGLVLRSPAGWELALSAKVSAEWLADLLGRLS